MKKTAVILFNLGGPDKPDSIRPFLFNLFNDPAIIGAPLLVRWWLAKRISAKRAPVAAEIYKYLGGKSPLLDLTKQQAAALELSLGDGYKTFVCMRYWHPMTAEVVKQVKAYNPDQIVLLPLYPQYSVTTSGSSVEAWHKEAKKRGMGAPTTTVCCYPTHKDFTYAVADLTLQKYQAMDRPRILFSAHGLPKKIIEGGDPYQWQVEQSAKAVVEATGLDDLDWVVCYQSKVGPLEWIGPSTDAEIERAGKDGKGVLVVPIAFVSEHSETLVELDIEYKELAEEKGVPAYGRVATVGTHELFIRGLAQLVRHSLDRGGVCSQDKGRLCPKALRHCPNKGAETSWS